MLMRRPASPLTKSKARTQTNSPASRQSEDRQHRSGRPILNRADNSRSHHKLADSIRLTRRAQAVAVRYSRRPPCPPRNRASPRAARNSRRPCPLPRLWRPSMLRRRPNLPLLGKRKRKRKRKRKDKDKGKDKGKDKHKHKDKRKRLRLRVLRRRPLPPMRRNWCRPCRPGLPRNHLYGSPFRRD